MTKGNFGRVWSEYRRSMRGYRGLIILTLSAYACASVFSSVRPLVYRSIVDILGSADDRAAVTAQIFDRFWWLATLILLAQLSFRVGDYGIARAEAGVMGDLMNRTLSRLDRHSYRFFADNFVGSLVAKAKRFVSSFEQLFDQIMFSVWMTAVSLVTILVSLSVVSPLLASVFFIWIVVYIPVVYSLVRFQAPYDTEAARRDSLAIARFSDIVSNILAVKMFSSSGRERKSFARFVAEASKTRYRAWEFSNRIFIIQAALLGALELVAMYLALRLWITGSVSTGTVVLVQIYIGSIFGSLLHIGRVFSRLAKSVADASEMAEIFELPHDIADPDDSRPFAVSSGEIRFNDVTFRYADGEGPVFDRFSLRVVPGEKVGLVGSSGSGKSTLTKLLLRFADPQSGSIEIDGQDIRRVRQDDLRSAIAYVPQEPLLFHRSIRENIAYGRPDATDGEVSSAASKAHADGFIARLPKEYDTLVGERGVKLSGGERQRVAIARAILKNAPILVLDEATSALDSESEHLIQLALGELMQGKTAIVIAHRLSTVRKLDRIVVLDREGRIAEEGSHEALLTRGGLYADLWSRQTGGFIDESED